MVWPPTVGKLLPRAAEAWSEPSKWDQWILSPRGHGHEWARVLRVGPDDVDVIWAAITKRLLVDPVSGSVDVDAYGLSCRVDTRLTIGSRSARVRTIWHYADSAGRPRLVTAYPRL